MKNVLQFIAAAVIGFIAVFLLYKFPLHSLAGLGVVIVVTGLYDLIQKEHAILRNFPVIGHFRYLFEGIGPEIRQYFVEADIDGKPLNRNQRTYIYARAKQDNSAHPFGSEHDMQKENFEWAKHSIYPAGMPDKFPRVTIGGGECTQPYSASLLNVSAMSFGALSKNAVMALNLGAKAGGFYHNTGEGGISPYHKMGGDIVFQVGTAYFGCRDNNGNFSEELFKTASALPEVKMIELKLSQGAKPGHGGILPAVKNNEEIAAIRGVEPHTTIVSPPGHTAFDTPRGLLEFIQKLRKLSGGKPAGFKLCVGDKKEFEDICLAMAETGLKPDFITVDGAEGGTGAAPITFTDHVGMPWENGLVFVIDTLRKYDLKKDIKVITSTKIINGFDILKALCLGADLCNSARAMMLALGCIQALECHKNTCPTGITTNNERLMRGLVVEDKWVRVKNYQAEAIQDFLDIMIATGCSSPEQLDRSFIFRQVDGKSVPFSELYPEPAAAVS